MSRFRACIISLLCLSLGLLFPAQRPPVQAQPNQYYVAPGGNDRNPGTQSAPFQTIQRALDVAQPGAVIHLAPGVYAEDPRSQRSGQPDQPITITGSRAAILRGSGEEDRVFQINHSYITLQGFTIDGLDGNRYRDKLIFVQSLRERTPLRGLRILNMRLVNAGGECIRLRYYVEEAEIAYNTIQACGQDDFPDGEWRGRGKNGEAIYIGTAPEQQDDGKNPEDGPDRSRNNHIHHNLINTLGNECVDIKEHATANLVEHNVCTGQRDPESGGFSARGENNTFRYNLSDGNEGAGIRFGGDDDGSGINNTAYGNSLTNNQYGALKIEKEPQQTVCGNYVAANGTNEGNYGDDYPPAATCPRSVALPAGFPPDTATARSFQETDFAMYGRIRTYWEQNGGLPVFGLPIGPPQVELLEGRLVTVQWFERNRLELHPEQAAPYDVLLGRLGADRLAQRGDNWQSATREPTQPNCRYFAETGRNVCGDILARWRANGLEFDGQPGFSEAENLALFGLPLTGLIRERLSDGNEYQVQYFERARFELHPANPPPANVLLGLLGQEIRTDG